MAAIFNSPSKYIQGPDELAKLGSYVEPLGAKALVIVTPSGKKRVGAKIEGGFTEAKAELLFEDFNGECSKGEVDRLVALARDNGCDIIVGVGGGKILDTAKAVAYYLESPVIICPTIASTDAHVRRFRCSIPMTASSTNTSSLRQTPISSLWIRRLSRRARCA